MAPSKPISKSYIGSQTGSRRTKAVSKTTATDSVPVEIVRKVIEVPEIQVLERIVEVPTLVCKDKITYVPKVEYRERKVPIYKPKYIEQEVEVPVYVNKEVIRERIVEVPKTEIEYIDKEVIVPRYYDVSVPQAAHRTVQQLIVRNIPRPVKLVERYGYELPKLKPVYTDVPVPVYVPRYVEIPIPAQYITQDGIILSEKLLPIDTKNEGTTKDSAYSIVSGPGAFEISNDSTDDSNGYHGDSYQSSHGAQSSVSSRVMISHNISHHAEISV